MKFFAYRISAASPNFKTGISNDLSSNQILHFCILYIEYKNVLPYIPGPQRQPIFCSGHFMKFLSCFWRARSSLASGVSCLKASTHQILDLQTHIIFYYSDTAVHNPLSKCQNMSSSWHYKDQFHDTLANSENSFPGSATTGERIHMVRRQDSRHKERSHC